MPRFVVPIWCRSGAFAQRVEFAVERQDEGTFSAIRRFSRPIVSPCAESRSTSATRARGSSTTPLPMTPSLRGRTTPEGRSESL